MANAAQKSGAARRMIGLADIVIEGVARTVAVNLDESPLASLMRRRDSGGRAYLSGEEFDAGERLRMDFTHSQLIQRVSANWSAPVSHGPRAAHDSLANLTDNALAARQRVEQALAAVGPELSGTLVDICCFLKGMEQVERDRQWPARSAKLMLKAGLAALHRHYHPPRNPIPRGIRHWGGEGYRPGIG